MLKNVIFAASILLTATVITTPPASAEVHRTFRSHHGLAGRPLHSSIHLGRVRSPGRIRSYAGVGHRFSRLRGTRHGIVLARRGYGRHHRRFAAVHGGRLIQPEVVSAPTGGTQVGGASYYGGRSHTASGGFVGTATCAHRTLPFGTRVLVTNLANARRAMLVVNDRGPFVRGRIVDVSVGAASLLGMLHSGTARVSVQVVGGPG